MTSIVIRCLEKIVADAGKPKGDAGFMASAFHRISPNEKKLQDTCKAAIEKIKGHGSFDPEMCVAPLRTVCESNLPELMVHAIGCLSELMEFGHLRAPLDEMQADGGGKTLLDTVIEVICECSQEGDDAVQLKVVQAVLTAVTSDKCEVHETQLQTAVRTCYSIHLTSRNAINQSVAKTGLSQMLTAVFERMETHFLEVRQRANDDTDSQGEDEEGTAIGNSTSAATLPDGSSAMSASPAEELAADDCDEKLKEQVDKMEEMRKSKESLSPSPGGDEATATEASIAEESAASVAEMTSTDPADLSHMGDLSVSEVEVAVGTPRAGGERSRASSYAFEIDPNHRDPKGERLMKDVILLFRALCKLAMKQLKEDVTAENVSVRTKVLSLELLDDLLKASGPVFRTSERCVYAVKNYLCMSLIQNSISSVPTIYRLTVSIFNTVMKHFKENLKTEIGVFFSSMLLRTLETDNSSFIQKLMVVETVHKFCEDGGTIVELFLNYDCDLESEDLYEKMVNALSRAAQGVHISNTGLTASQENKIKNQAMESLVTIVTSMSQWTSEMEKAETTKAEDDDEEEVEEVYDDDDMKQLEEKRTTKQLMNKGLAIFKEDPKKGVKYFVEQKVLEETPEAVANFFHETKGLSKKQIGDYIGRSKDFNKQVLHAYTDSLDFASHNFDESLRMFLQGFRLPGEACMIDPIMEKFAEQYYKCREAEGVFKNPDAAYVLSYSIMMLNTDLHNPGVKVKMTPEDFRRNLRGTNDGEDLPPEFLNSIFVSIRDNEITLKDDDRSWYSMDDQNQNMSDAKVRAQKWQTESEDAIKNMTNRMKDKSRKKVVYYAATHMQHVRPMFEVSRWPFLSAFSQYLEKAAEEAVIAQCLQGFKHAIHISCIFCMPTERDAYITSLSRFTQLMTMRDMQSKHIQTINALLYVARSEANYLQSTWHHVLTCISQVERLRLLGVGAKDDSDFFSGAEKGRAKKPAPRESKGDGKDGKEELLEEDFEKYNPADSKEDAQAVVELIEVTLIDEIFMNSGSFSSEAIVDFTTCLCLVALEEIHNAQAPRIFCSQKIVEVAHYNMDRIRIVWSRIWQQMSQHFYKAGCHPNLQIAMYAIDSLRQLGIKFLEKSELESYKFQKEFLQPFVLIMQNNSTEDIHELVIRCLQQVVESRCINLKSGWETVLHVLALAASDSFSTICDLGFQIVESLMTSNFKHASEPFHKFTQCLVAYACNPLNCDIGLKAIRHIQTTAEKMAEGEIAPPREDGLFDSGDAHSKPWLAILSSLCSVAWDPRAQIRSRALDVLFEILQENGSKFTLELWRLIFDRTIYPLFDACKLGKVSINPKAREDWLRKSCEGVLIQMVDTYCHHLELLTPYLEDFITYIYSIVAQPSMELSIIGMKALSYLIDKLGDVATADMWDISLNVVKKIFAVSTPKDFVEGAIKAADDDDVTTPSTARAKGADESSDVAFPLPETKAEALAEAEQEASEEIIDSPTPRTGMAIPAVEGEWKQPTREQFEAMTLMCTVQLLMIEACGKMFQKHRSRLLSRHILILVEALEGACMFAHDFNGNRGARSKLWNPELIEAPPDLYKQEIEALGVYLTILFSLYHEKEVEVQVRRDMAETRMISTMSVVLDRYITKTLKPTLVPEEVPEMMAFTPVIIQILQGINAFSDEQLDKHLPQLYLRVVEMACCSKNEARTLVKDILIRVGTLRAIVATGDGTLF